MNTTEERSQQKTIYMPVMVIFCGNRLVEMTADEFFARHARPAECGHVLFSNASNPHLAITELLDRKGYLHRVTPLRKRQAVLSWLAPVWDFTKMECQINTLGPLTAGEMAAEAQKWKNESGRKVRRFLTEQDPNAIFDEQMFRAAWESSYISLPEAEWNKVFELRE